MSRYTRIELLVYVSFWLLITSFAVGSSWNLERVSETASLRREISVGHIAQYEEAFQSYLDSKFLGK